MAHRRRFYESWLELKQLLQLLRDRRSLAPRETWEALALSKQGALDLLRPLVQAGLVKRIGTQKTCRYILASNASRRMTGT